MSDVYILLYVMLATYINFYAMHGTYNFKM